MATNTTKLQLRKPADADNVDVTLDISDNMDKIDNEFIIPFVDAYLNANINLAGGNSQTINNWTEIEDSANAFDASTGIFTCPAGQAGIYIATLGYSIGRTGGTVSAGNAWWAKNGTAQEAPRCIVGNAGANTPDGWEGTLTRVVRLAVGDTLRAMFQANATSCQLNAGTAAVRTTLTIVRCFR